MIYDKQIIYGSIPSKSNSYKIVTLGGHGTLAKTKETKKYEESFFMQCSIRNTEIRGLSLQLMYISPATVPIWIMH